MPRARPIAPILLAVLLGLVAFAAGCGDSSGGSGYGSRDSTEQPPTATATTPEAPPGASARSCGRTTVTGTEGLRVTGIGCDVGRGIVAAWTSKPSCAPGNEASRVSCTLPDGYGCIAAAVERGIAVSCSRPGSSLAFLAKTG